MKLKLIAGLLFCLISALLMPRSNGIAPGGSAAGPDDLNRLSQGSDPNGKSVHTYVERAGRKEALGDFDGALADYTMAIRLNPKSEIAHFNRAFLYFSRGSFSEAIADLDAVIRANPKAVEAYLGRGDAHAEMGHAKAALADYDSAIRYAIDTADHNLIEAKAYFGKGDYSNAALRFAKAKRRSPRDPVVLNSVAWFKATVPDSSFRNGKEALQESIKACELTKWQTAHTVDTLAAAYAEAADFNQAIKYQTQALGMKPLTPNSVKQMQKRLRLYQARKPFREEPPLRKTRT